jgi:hypothetical protein
MTPLRILLSALLMAACAAAAGSLAGLDLREYEEGIERADRDAGPHAWAIAICARGFVGQESESSAWRCNREYEFAMTARDYESAMDAGASAGLATRQEK